MEIRNRLLASLKTEDLRLFERHLREVPMEQGEMLEEPGGYVDAVYFPQSGMISLIVQMPEDSTVEVGMVGSEGAIGMTVGLARFFYLRAGSSGRERAFHPGLALSNRCWPKRAHSRPDRPVLRAPTGSNTTDGGL